MTCTHIVYHPPVNSKQWVDTLATLRQESDHGSGAYIPILSEQLFGQCDAREGINEVHNNKDNIV